MREAGSLYQRNSSALSASLRFKTIHANVGCLLLLGNLCPENESSAELVDGLAGLLTLRSHHEPVCEKIETQRTQRLCLRNFSVLSDGAYKKFATGGSIV